jgi:beta-glucosidase
MFDPPEVVPYAQIPLAVVNSAEHRTLALRAARESIVLLKNQDNLLPLGKDLKRIAVIGPNADDALVLLGNYHGTPASSVTPLAGIRAKVGPQTEVLYARGCDILDESTSGFANAVELARRADVVIFVGGLSQRIEGEEGQTEGVQGRRRSQGDRTELNLPGVQEELLKAIQATGKPVALLLLNGSALAIHWAKAQAPAIVEAWYPGEQGGTAIADVLFGDYNPGGRLPITFYKSVEDLPPFAAYSMNGRTYRYFQGEPLFAFGYGLSYTTFAYSNLQLRARVITPSEELTLSVDVRNTGRRAGDEVAQFYVSDVAASLLVPLWQLAGFKRIHLEPGETKTIAFRVTPYQLSLVNERGRRVIEPGRFEIAVGGCLPDLDDYLSESTNVLMATIEVVGQVTEID